LDPQLRAPNPHRDLLDFGKGTLRARLAVDLVYDFRLSGIVGAGTSAVLISLKVIFFEPSTRFGLAGRFLDWG